MTESSHSSSAAGAFATVAPWILHPHAIVRTTGFPFEALDALVQQRTVELIDLADVLDRSVGDAVGRVVTAAIGHPTALTAGASRKVRRALKRRSTLPGGILDETTPDLAERLATYDRAVVRRDAALERLRKAAAAEAAEVHARLAGLMTGERWSEAIWLQSPSLHDHGLRQLADGVKQPHAGRARAVRRQFAGYLQRLCAKNETTAFFGPVDYADFEPPSAGAPRTGPPAQRHAYVAYWVVEALADRIAEDSAVRPWLKPRVGSLVGGLDEPPLTRAGKRISLSPDAVTLLRACDGERTVAELATLHGREQRDMLAAVERLADARLLVLDCRPPISEPRALEWLGTFLESLPNVVAARWREAVNSLVGDQDAFAGAQLGARRVLLSRVEARLAKLVGPQRVRRSGGWYADRLALYEECLGALTPLHLGCSMRERLVEQLGPVLTVLAGEAVAHHRALTRAFLERHPRLSAGETVPLLDLLTSTPELEVQAACTPVRDEIERRVEAAGAEQTVEIAPSDLPPADLGDDPLIAAPDALFLTHDAGELHAGNADVVLGECHDALMLWGWALQFHPDCATVEREGARLLARAAGDRVLANVLGSQRAKIVPFIFPGPIVDGVGARPPDDAPLSVRIADIGAQLVDGRLVCCRAGMPPFLLHNGELDSAVHNVLAPPRVRPVTFGHLDRTPRIRLGRAVLQRARWRVRRDELLGPPGADPLATARYMRAAARRLGLPRRVFARIPGERKPVLLDSAAPVLIELVAHLSRDVDKLVLTEMLPASEHLWLTGPAGRHCAEIRLTLVLDRTRLDD